MVLGAPRAFVSAEVCYPLASDGAGLGFPQVPGGALLVAFPARPWAWVHLDASQAVDWAYVEVRLSGWDEVASASLGLWEAEPLAVHWGPCLQGLALGGSQALWASYCFAGVSLGTPL